MEGNLKFLAACAASAGLNAASVLRVGACAVILTPEKHFLRKQSNVSSCNKKFREELIAYYPLIAVVL
jgi:hypothetical protein